MLPGLRSSSCSLHSQGTIPAAAASGLEAAGRLAGKGDIEGARRAAQAVADKYPYIPEAHYNLAIHLRACVPCHINGQSHLASSSVACPYKRGAGSATTRPLPSTTSWPSACAPISQRHTSISVRTRTRAIRLNNPPRHCVREPEPARAGPRAVSQGAGAAPGVL